MPVSKTPSSSPESHGRVLTDALPTVVVLLAKDGSVLYLTPASPEGEISLAVGKPLSGSLSPDSQDVADECVAAAVDGRTSEVELTGVDGRTYLARFAPLDDVAGDAALVMVGVDVTNHDRVVEALRASEQTHRTLVDNMRDVVFSLDTEGVVRYISPAIHAIAGFAPEEVVGKGFRDFLHPDDVAEVTESFENVLSGKPQPSEYRVRAKDGHYRWVQSESSLVTSPDGEESMQGLLRDVTLRRRAEEALTEAESRYRSMFENAVFGICLLTPDARFLDVNQALVEMLGYSDADELRAADMDDGVYAETSERQRFIDEMNHVQGVGGVDVRWKRKTGDVIVVRLAGRMLRRDDGHIDGYEIIAEDVTARQALEEQYRQAQKMEAIGRLAGGVAHDFNNLLTVINGHADLVLSSIRPSDPLYKDLAEIKKAGERAASLTAQLLAFSRKQILRPAILDLNEVISNGSGMLRRIIGEDIELQTQLEDGLSPVVADRSQLEQVVMNLAINARDAMPRGGRLTITTYTEILEPSKLPSRAPSSSERFSVMSIDDTGVGITDDVQRHMFEPFFTTKEESRGTGLGLSTVYGIIEQSGGFIEVDSELGRGSSFKILLPQVEVAAPQAEKEESAPSSAETLQDVGTVLVVEDDDAVRITAVEMLETCGFSVYEARDGQEALAFAETRKGALDLLLTDVVMPGISGCELAEAMTAVDPTLRVLYMTGYADEDVLAQPLRDREHVLLKKPFSLVEIVEKVREALAAPVRE